jgi:hypothetical protein
VPAKLTFWTDPRRIIACAWCPSNCGIRGELLGGARLAICWEDIELSGTGGEVAGLTHERLATLVYEGSVRLRDSVGDRWMA